MKNTKVWQDHAANHIMQADPNVTFHSTQSVI